MYYTPDYLADQKHQTDWVRTVKLEEETQHYLGEHGEGWDGHHDGNDANYWGPSLDHSDGVHPAEPDVRAGQDRKVSDQRRAFANMMSKSKENVGTILRSVSLDEARVMREKIDEYVSFLLKKPDGGDAVGPKNPARPPQKGSRPKENDSRGKPLDDRGGTSGRKKTTQVWKLAIPRSATEVHAGRRG